MGVFGSYRSMTWESDGLAQVDAPINHSTLYDVTNYTGRGILFMVSQYNADGYADNYISITTDGNAHVWAPGEFATACASLHQLSAGTALALGVNINMNLEFNTSLLVQIANDDAIAVQYIAGITHYGIFSKEFDRKIIPAGSPLPERDERYDFDVMVVYFCSKMVGGKPTGISSKIQFPQPPKVNLWVDPATGKLAGELKKFEFDDRQSSIGDNTKRYIQALDDRDTVEMVDVVQPDGSIKWFSVPIVKGKVKEKKIVEIPRAVSVNDLLVAKVK